MMNEPLSPYETNESAPQMSPISGASGKRPMPFPIFRELTLLSGVLISVFFLPYLYMQVSAPVVDATSALAVTGDGRYAATTTEVALPDVHMFDHLALLGKAAAVYDVSRDEFLYVNNAEETLPIASVTKLMTALVSFELFSSMDTVVTIPPQTTSEYSALKEGDTLTARSLLDYTLLVSSNEGAQALAAAAAREALGKGADVSDFVRAMNIRAKSLGLTETVFRNPTGLDMGTTTAGAESSARDIAHLLAYITTTYPDLLASTALPKRTFTGGAGYIYEAVNTNGVANEIPGLIASKTGYEDLAGGSLAVAFNAGLGRTIIVVVLGSTRNGRFDDILRLVDTTRDAL